MTTRIVIGPELAVLGYAEAAMFLRGPRGSNVRAIVSIHGRREFGVESSVVPRIDLTFDDVEVPEPGDEMTRLRAASRRRHAVENGLVEEPPTAADAAAIVSFAESLRDMDDGVVLCHCGAGMSLAPAAALICLAVWAGIGAEAECMAEVRRVRRGAVPHLGLVRFADALLGRGNRLIDATRQAGRPA